MKTILAPTRGGEHSYANQDRAIALAKESGAELIFLYISDVQFLNQVASPMLVDVVAELEEMGEFLLVMAQERASQEGIEAQAIVRSGEFKEVLEKEIPQNNVDILVLGTSSEETGLTTPKYLDKLAAELANAHKVRVILLRDGEVVETVSPN